MSSSEQQERLVTKPFLIAAVANFFQSLAGTLYLHYPGFLSQDLHADKTTVGVLVSAMFGASVVVRPFAGRWSDRFGRKPIALGFASLQAMACFLYTQVDAADGFAFLVRVLHGFGSGGTYAALFALAIDATPVARRTEGLALFGVSGILPIAMGGLFGDALVEEGGYALLFRASLMLAVLSMVLMTFVPETLSRLARDEKKQLASRGIGAVFRDRSLYPLWIVGVGFSMGLGASYAFLKTFVLEEGIGTTGAFFAFYSAAAIVLRVGFGWLPERFGLLRVLYPSIVCVSLAMCTLGIATHAEGIWLAGTLCGIGHGYSFPICSALAAKRARPAEMGLSVSIFTATFDSGLLLAGPIFGAIASATSFRTMFFAAALVPVLCASLFAALERKMVVPVAPLLND